MYWREISFFYRFSRKMEIFGIGGRKGGRGRQEKTQQPEQSEPFAYVNLCRTLTSSEKGRKVRIEKRSLVSLGIPCNLFRGILDSHAMH